MSAPLSEHVRQCAGLTLQNRGGVCVCVWWVRVCVGDTGNSRAENGSLVTNKFVFPPFLTRYRSGGRLA